MISEKAEMHVRRLEAMRRLIGAPDRQPDGSWVIDQDHLANAERYEREKSRRMPVRIETLSVRQHEQLPHHDDATGLDREMTRNRPERLSAGLAADVRKSLADRQTGGSGKKVSRR